MNHDRRRAKRRGIAFLIALITLAAGAWAADTDGPYQAMGIKVGEVTDTTAIVWTRLTRRPARIGSDAPMPAILYRNPDTGELGERPKGRPDVPPVVQYPEGVSIEDIEGAVPGAKGEVRVRYRPENDTDWESTSWRAVDPERDFTRQFTLTDLEPATRYAVRVEVRKQKSEQQGQACDGAFQTAPPPDRPARVVFTVSTGQSYKDQDVAGGGYRIYPAMAALAPHFFVHTGDIVYYDGMAKSQALARWHWARMYSLPTNVEFHRHVASYFIKDDHDTWMNDCWPGMDTRFMGDFTLEQGLAVFREQVPMGTRTYRTVRWGKDLQMWLVEGRDYRSPNTMRDGPEKTIWGAEQKAWFKRTVQASDAAFRILISPTPLVGPDRQNKRDNHANVCFKHEGDELRRFIATQKDMVVLCGDRHWQYVSVSAETGVREYCCGPASNEHAGGWSNDQVTPEHRYLNVIGGFLAVTVDRSDGAPTMTLRHHDVDGAVLHEDRRVAQ